MKILNENKNRKKLIVSLLLVLVIVGTAATLAIAVAQSNQVLNSFAAAEHDTGIDEPETGTPDKKVVKIKNEASSGKAFIRARITVSPEDAIDLDTLSVEEPWKRGDDGFYYYLKPVEAKGETEPLLNGVTPKTDFTGETFDVTVYEESCIADTTEETVTLDVIKKAFEEAEASGKITSK